MEPGQAAPTTRELEKRSACRKARKQVRPRPSPFDAEGRTVLTTFFPPRFDPAPSIVYMLARGKGVAALDRLHTQALQRHSRPAAPITVESIGETVVRMEEITYAHLLSRGVYSDKYER